MFIVINLLHVLYSICLFGIWQRHFLLTFQRTRSTVSHILYSIYFLFLLLQEWEEKLTEAKEETMSYKRKYTTVKDGKEVSLMEDARTVMSQKFNQGLSINESSMDGTASSIRSSSFRASATNRPEFKRAAESVTSMSSNLAAHAKTLVGSFACAGGNTNNERTTESTDRATEEWRGRRNVVAANDNANDDDDDQQQRQHPGLEMSQSSPYNNSVGSNRSYRENRRVDV